MNRRQIIAGIAAAPAVALAEQIERLRQPLESYSALQRLRAQILYATRGKSRPTEMSLPTSEWGEVVRDIYKAGQVPMMDEQDRLVVFGVRVLRDY